MRLIYADALKEVFKEKGSEAVCGVELCKAIISQIDNQPTVEAEPVRHGKWKQWDSYGFEDTYECTACGESFVLIEGTPITNGYKYCPSCGAKMDMRNEK